MSDNSDQSDGLLSSSSLDKALDYFRWRLEQFGSWPGRAGALLDLLRQMQEEASVNEVDEEMLSLVVDDALRGTDIASRYPFFFKKLLTTDALREAFLDCLDLLEQSRAGTLSPLPAPPSRSLDFLYQNKPEVKIERTVDGRWHVSLQQAAEQLQRIFSMSDAPTQTSYRLKNSFAEDEWFTLFHRRVVIEGRPLEAALEAMQISTEPLLLRLMAVVTIAPANDSAPDTTEQLQARLEWGDFDETVPVGFQNQAVFSPISLRTVMDPAGEKVTSALRLSMEITG